MSYAYSKNFVSANAFQNGWIDHETFRREFNVSPTAKSVITYAPRHILVERSADHFDAATVKIEVVSLCETPEQRSPQPDSPHQGLEENISETGIKSASQIAPQEQDHVSAPKAAYCQTASPQPGCSFWPSHEFSTTLSSPTSPDPEMDRPITPCIKIPLERVESSASNSCNDEAKNEVVSSTPRRPITPCVKILLERVESSTSNSCNNEAKIEVVSSTPRLIRSSKKISCGCENMCKPCYQIKRGCICVICAKRFYKRRKNDKIAWRVCIPCCGVVCPDCRREKKCSH